MVVSGFVILGQQAGKRALRACLEQENPTASAIYARNLEVYAPLLESAARRLDIPVSIARRALSGRTARYCPRCQK